VASGANVNALDAFGTSVLLSAVDKSQAGSVAELLRLGADPNFQYDDGFSLLHVYIGELRLAC
jgi:ankyrin repeat protein